MAGQTSVYNNVVRYRLTDNGVEIEDVTGFTPPEVENPVSTISVGAMSGEIELPDLFVNAMTLSITHNNGKNCNLLRRPGKHSLVLSVARQKYDSAGQEMGYENVTYRMIAMHKKLSDGQIQTKNPIGGTEDFSCTRYEKRVNGVEEVLIDVPAGIVRYNGVDYTNDIESALQEK